MPMPPDITTSRFQVFCRYRARSYSSGVSSSSAVVPAISQNPPTGISPSP